MEPKVVAFLNIEMDEAGQIKVNGALDNKLLAYGLLEVAKEVVNDYNKAKTQQVKLAPAGLSLGLVPNRG